MQARIRCELGAEKMIKWLRAESIPAVRWHLTGTSLDYWQLNTWWRYWQFWLRDSPVLTAKSADEHANPMGHRV
jgi:hypothetical protein